MLKSTNAKGEWSFLKPRNKAIIAQLIKKYSEAYSVKVFSSANVGNHLHFHLQFRSPRSYRDFVRAMTGAIALKITGSSKIKALKERFWTQSPYTRFVFGIKDFLKISDYIKINQLEGFGHGRAVAEYLVRNRKHEFG